MHNLLTTVTSNLYTKLNYITLTLTIEAHQVNAMLMYVNAYVCAHIYSAEQESKTKLEKVAEIKRITAKMVAIKRYVY